MEPTFVNSLTQIVARAENAAMRIRSLKLEDDDVFIPDLPVPLSLKTVEEWLDLAAEACRKPRLAKSKRLLHEKKIPAAGIPAAVLDSPDSIAKLLGRADRLHERLQAAAFDTIGRALTKGFEDAEAVVAEFEAASREISALAKAEGWIVALAAARSSEKPSEAEATVETAKRVAELYNSASQKDIKITPSSSLENALAILTDLNTCIQEYDRLLASEGLSHERASLVGLSVDEARNKLKQEIGSIGNKKNALIQEADGIRSRLRLIGVETRDTASTLAELEELVPQLRRLLAEKRDNLRDSLGSTALCVLESLTEGKLPPSEEVTDEQLGNAIRKATEGGYRIQLEAPRENR